jgi:hypothetical protein
MNIAKSILGALGLILLIALTGVYFLPDRYTVSQTIDINCPRSVVYEYVGDYSKWQKWSPWMDMDPQAQVAFEGKPGTNGHKMSWKSNKTGHGSLTIVKASATDIDGELNIQRPISSLGHDKWKFDEQGKQTKVTWTSTGPLKYPFGRLMGISVDEILGSQEKEGLDKLKEVCEQAYAEKTQTAKSVR